MNLSQVIEAHPAAAVALSRRGTATTYGELRSAVRRARGGLSGLGVSEGDRVGLLLGGSESFVVGYLATLGLGAVAVPLDPASPSAALERELATVRPALVLREEAGAARSSAPLPVGAGEATVPSLLSSPDGPEVVERSPDDAAVLVFTSGTAGAPKAAVLSHGNLLANIEQIELRVGLGARAGDVGILAIPPFHVLGLNAVLGLHLRAGSRLVLLERFDAAALLEEIAREKVTLLAGVPQLFSALARLPAARGDELSSLRLACSGAAPLPDTVAREFEGRYGVRLWQGYGLTEASPAVTFPDVAGPYRPGSVGLPLPGVEVRVVDEDGAEVEPGDPGEILVRGPNVFSGYFEQEDATAAVLDEQGFLHTGDVAVVADDGSLSIVDRQKDLIIVSGFNVFPAEVEEVLAAHPGVAAAAVVGAEDERLGERVHAFVVPAEGSEAPSAEALGEHCARHLPRYKCPAQFSFVPELPTSTGGKVVRGRRG